MFSKPATKPLRNIFANYHFCGLLGATGGCSPYIPHAVFLQTWDHDGAKSKTSELRTKLPEGTSFSPLENIETNDGYISIYSFMMVGACASEQWNDNFDNITLHNCSTKSISCHVNQWISRFLILNHLKPPQTKTTIYIFAGSIINCHWFNSCWFSLKVFMVKWHTNFYFLSVWNVHFCWWIDFCRLDQTPFFPWKYHHFLAEIAHLWCFPRPFPTWSHAKWATWQMQHSCPGWKPQAQRPPIANIPVTAGWATHHWKAANWFHHPLWGGGNRGENSFFCCIAFSDELFFRMPNPGVERRVPDKQSVSMLARYTKLK